MSHLILTHCREDSGKVQRLKEYCKYYNSANQMNDHRISNATRERNDRREFEHRRGNFFFEERWRKAYWEQNRQLRRDGQMLYVYSQKTRNEGLYNHRADTETGQVPLYYNPTDASGYGDLSNHGPDHEFWRQGTPQENRAARNNRGAHDQRPPDAHAHGLPPRSTPQTRTAPAAPNPAQYSDQGRHSAASHTAPNSAARGAGNREATRTTAEASQSRNKKLPAAAQKAAQHRENIESASRDSRELTQQERAVLFSGVDVPTSRDEGDVVDDLETEKLARIQQFAETRMLLEFFEKSNRDVETTDMFLASWDEHVKELDRIDSAMDNAVLELKQLKSSKLREWKTEQRRRQESTGALNDKFNEVIQAEVSPAAGS
jgi:hypothetical protein